jgi:hypothetical protein
LSSRWSVGARSSDALIATALAPVSPYLTIAICASVAAFYALPVATGSERGG